MHPDFIKLKPLEGELKISHKKGHFGITVSTKEMVLHRPHANYYVNYEDIVSIIPAESKSLKQLRLVAKQPAREEIVQAKDGTQQFSMHVSQATVHNRSGIFAVGTMQFVIPIHRELMEAIGRFGKWDVALEL